VKVLRSALLSGTALLAGCAVGPDYERPELDIPAAYLDQINDGESIANLPWWQIFDDPQLNELVLVALENNRDLRVAAARVAESRALLGVTRAGQFPTLDGSATFTRGNQVSQFVPGVGVQENYFLGLLAGYEADIWGKFRRATEASRAELLATEDNQRAVVISLVADVASTYLLLRDFDSRVDIARDTLTARQSSTDLIQARFDKGTVALIDVNQAQILEADAAAQLASLKRQARQAENQLNLLIGQNPRPIVRGKELSDVGAVPDVPAGLPAELLARRPDVRAAEQALAAQTARIGVAQAARLPSITLTGTAGFTSTELSGLIDSDNELWGVGIDIFGPIFDAGKRRNQVEAEKARTEQALNNYEQTVLNALREVADALAGIEGFREEFTARQEQLTAALSASQLSWARYNGGVTSYLEVLDSDRNLFAAQLAVSQIRRAKLVAVITLYRALGGGWELPKAEAAQ